MWAKSVDCQLLTDKVGVLWAHFVEVLTRRMVFIRVFVRLIPKPRTPVVIFMDFRLIVALTTSVSKIGVDAYQSLVGHVRDPSIAGRGFVVILSAVLNAQMKHRHEIQHRKSFAALKTLGF